MTVMWRLGHTRLLFLCQTFLSLVLLFLKGCFLSPHLFIPSLFYFGVFQSKALSLFSLFYRVLLSISLTCAPLDLISQADAREPRESFCKIKALMNRPTASMLSAGHICSLSLSDSQFLTGSTYYLQDKK